MLCIHGEVVDPEVDFFEREQVFIANKLEPILAQVPNLKVVIEHATTKEAVAFVENSQHPAGIGCTITPQHMLYNRNALFNKGLNPHFFCLPILKREEDRLELLRAGECEVYGWTRLRLATLRPLAGLRCVDRKARTPRALESASCVLCLQRHLATRAFSLARTRPRTRRRTS